MITKTLSIVCLLCLLVGCQQPTHSVVVPPSQQVQVTPKIEGTYKGTWTHTNEGLAGVTRTGDMSCVVSDLGNGKWKGNFSGVWRRKKFSYTVDWAGNANDLHGTAVIDGVNYQWSGSITQDKFKGTYTSKMYSGSFLLYNSPTDARPHNPY